MKLRDILSTTRNKLNNAYFENSFVDALVLRRYRNGLADSLRVDDSTNGEVEIPSGYTHVLVVLEMPIDPLLKVEKA